MKEKKIRALLKDSWVKIKRKASPHYSTIRLFFFLIISAIVFSLIYLIAPWLIKLVNNIFVGPKVAISLLTADTSNLESYNNRTNILVLGIGGETHEEIDLTDTIIFASIDKASADTAMFSIPRDLWIDPLKTKINAVYHYGQEREEKAGFVLSKDAVYQVVNQPIHYSVLIDFEGFIKIIDLLGGVQIKVDRAFDDYKYPIPGRERDECNGDLEYKCRYEHLRFETGEQQMDGKTALKFVRSRNAEGEEGTDFARSQRQQKVILAVAKKMFSYKMLLNPSKIMEVKKAFGDHIKFDNQFDEDQITAFLSLFLRFIKNKNEIRTISLDTGNNDSPGFLYNPPIEKYNQWVLVPRIENWSEIHKYVEEKIYKGY